LNEACESTRKNRFNLVNSLHIILRFWNSKPASMHQDVSEILYFRRTSCLSKFSKECSCTEDESIIDCDYVFHGVDYGVYSRLMGAVLRNIIIFFCDNPTPFRWARHPQKECGQFPCHTVLLEEQTPSQKNSLPIPMIPDF